MIRNLIFISFIFLYLSSSAQSTDTIKENKKKELINFKIPHFKFKIGSLNWHPYSRNKESDSTKKSDQTIKKPGDDSLKITKPDPIINPSPLFESESKNETSSDTITKKHYHNNESIPKHIYSTLIEIK